MSHSHEIRIHTCEAGFQKAFWLVFLLASGVFLGGCAGVALKHGSNGSKEEMVLENRWVRSTLKSENLGFRQLNRFPPIVLPEVVIQGNSVDGIVAFRRDNGSVIWRLNIENGVEGGAQVVEDRLYFGASDSQFYAVQWVDGKVLWKTEVPAETLAPPTVEDGIVYFQSGADVVYALDAQTGKQLWLYNRQSSTNFSVRATTRPTISGESIYVGFSDGFVLALRKRDGHVLWERKIGRNNRFRDVDSTPVIDGERLYVACYDGSLYALSITTGEVIWQIDEGGYLPVTLGNDFFPKHLYFATVDGKILILDRSTGKIINTIAVKNGISTQVALFKKFLVYGQSAGNLVVADGLSGKEIAVFAPGHGVLARPTVDEETGEVFFVSNSANLYVMSVALENRIENWPWRALGSLRW